MIDIELKIFNELNENIMNNSSLILFNAMIIAKLDVSLSNAEIADILGTLINDLIAMGLLQSA